VLGCHNDIKSFKGLTSGICEDHIKLFTSNDFHVGVCWNCGAITGAYEISRRLKGILTEKYLFSKGCSKCSQDKNAEVNWITVKKHTAKHYWAIDDNGKLNKVRSTDTTPTSIKEQIHD
jgi:hypothetical protein